MTAGTISDPLLTYAEREVKTAILRLHAAADRVVTLLEHEAILKEPNAKGDRARALLATARHWRAVVEAGE